MFEGFVLTLFTSEHHDRVVTDTDNFILLTLTGMVVASLSRRVYLSGTNEGINCVREPVLI